MFRRGPVRLWRPARRQLRIAQLELDGIHNVDVTLASAVLIVYSERQMDENAERYLFRTMKRACQHYDLLAPSDRVLVAVSGGKDSYTLLYLLRQLVPRLPFEVELFAVHLDQRQPGYDGRALAAWLESFGVPFEILSEDTYSVVTSLIEETKTYCSLCSRLRRGILYGAAERLGCNKIALGHHREDTLETFLMNLLYSGKLQAMPAKYRTDDGRFEVIRPLIACAENRIAEFARQQAFPIIPCNLCGSQTGLKRERMAELLSALEGEVPNVKSIMLSALGNVAPSHLLDQEVVEAWSARPPHIRPGSAVSPPASAAESQPEAASHVYRLPLAQAK